MQQTKKIDENQSKDLMDSLFNDAFNNPNPSAISNNFNVSSLQHSLKPSENMAEIYKSNFEKSKDIYDISIKPLKKQEETNSTFIQPKKFQPLQNLNKIEEENPVEKLPTPIKPSPISKFPAEKEKSSHKPKLTQLTDLKPQPIIEEPIIEIETIEEPSIRGNIEMDEQNNKWNNVNENSDVLLSNAFEKSKDVNEIYDEDGNLLIYYYDAYEDNHAYPGVVFVFGKVLFF